MGRPPRRRHRAVARQKAQSALGVIWPLVDELFRTNDTEKALPRTAADSSTLRGGVDVVLDTVLATARLERPDAAPLAAVAGRTGRDGVHTEALGYVLAELQSVARQDPEATW